MWLFNLLRYCNYVCRFTQLLSLNLSFNNLNNFPLSVLELSTLLELNLGGNHLSEIPTNIDRLKMYDYLLLFGLFTTINLLHGICMSMSICHVC